MLKDLILLRFVLSFYEMKNVLIDTKLVTTYRHLLPNLYIAVTSWVLILKRSMLMAVQWLLDILWVQQVLYISCVVIYVYVLIQVVTFKCLKYGFMREQSMFILKSEGHIQFN